MSIPQLAAWLRLSVNRTYILTRKPWFPRTTFLGRILLNEAQVKRAVRARFYQPPQPELFLAEHTTLLTLAEAAETVSRSPATLRRLARQRRIGHYDVGRLLFPLEELSRLGPALNQTRQISRAPAGCHIAPSRASHKGNSG